jgi:MFS family permease
MHTSSIGGTSIHSGPLESQNAQPRHNFRPINLISNNSPVRLNTRSYLLDKKGKEDSQPPSLIANAQSITDKADKFKFRRGLACIVGGALAHLTLGTFYCWGNFLSYAPPYLRYFAPELRRGGPPDALYVMPFTLIAQALAMPFGPQLVQKLGASNTLILGSWIAALAVYLASFQTRLWSFIVFYSLMFGTGAGLAYTAPMTAGWKWLPSYKGLVSGGILAGFGAGGFIFSLIGTKMVNPDALNPVQGKFPQSVYDSFPFMLRRLAAMYAVISFVGSLLVNEPKPTDVTKQSVSVSKSSNISPQVGLSVSEAMRTGQFWLLWLMIITSATGCLNTAVIYKQFAATSSALDGDGYQVMVGGIGALCNGIGRLFWGSISDKIGFKMSFSILTILQMVLMITYTASASSKVSCYLTH